jgi:heme A synthase
MPFLFFAAVALIGAAIHRHRDKQPRSSARTFEIFLIWWMVVAVGIAAIVGAMFHFFDGPTTAREIGFTNGDGVLWSDFIVPLVAIGLYVLQRRAAGGAQRPAPAS